MLCENCRKREANVKYSENINGVKKELNLCEECSKKLGITQMSFNIPIDFSNFFGGFMEDFATPEFMPLLQEIKQLKCNNCGYTFDDIAKTGKMGCEECYSVFEDRIDPILKKIQGSNHHIGRIGKIIDNKISNKNNENKINQKDDKPQKEQDRLSELKQELKQAIQEERYEEAAKIRDEIKKIEKEK